MLLDFVDFMVGSGGSGFWGGNPPTDPRVSGFVDGDPSPTVGLVGSGGGSSVSGRSDELIRYRGPMDTAPYCLNKRQKLTKPNQL